MGIASLQKASKGKPFYRPQKLFCLQHFPPIFNFKSAEKKETIV